MAFNISFTDVAIVGNVATPIPNTTTSYQFNSTVVSAPGPQGEQGPQGPAGATGPQGPQGIQGEQGPQGPQGVKGDTGDTGPQGIQGPKGDTGNTGPQGPAGADGVGFTSATVTSGNLVISKSDSTEFNAGYVVGPQGPQGIQGPKGDTGDTGPQGIQGIQGPQGETGPMGPQGIQGPIGLTGPQGPKGDTGADGATGPQGPAGADGATGPQGPAGADGATGPQGPQGIQGIQGPMGPQGPAGADGTSVSLKGAVPTVQDLPSTGNTDGDLWIISATGDGYVWGNSQWTNIGPIRGPQGEVGPQGPQGIQGIQGATGPQGPQGPQGVKGDTGDTGPMGPQGPQGNTGPAGPQGPAGAEGVMGPQGPQGEQGLQGETGPMGPQGPQGLQGLKGNTGDTGPMGPQGVTGPQGPEGPMGPTGPMGPQGNPGDTGPAGPQGPQGEVGPQGPQGPQGVQGAPGVAGPQGPAGPGLAAGGTAGQVITKIDDTNYNTQWTTLANVATSGSYTDLSNKPTNVSAFTNDAGYIANNDASATLGNVTIKSSVFNQTAAITPSVGQLTWDDANGTLVLGLKGGNTRLQVGQEQVVRVKNNTGSALTHGQVVYISGAQGEQPTVALASALSESNSNKTIGVVTEPITNGSEGFVTINGVVNDINTSAYVPGTQLWLSTTAGQFTNVRPTAPNHGVFVGWVIRQHASSGNIFVHVQNGSELNELHDVFITSETNKDAILYNSSNSRWENRALDASDIQSGHFSTSLLATGTPDATKFVRGDGVWAVPTTGQGGIGNILCYDQNNVQDDIQIAAYDELDTFTVNNQLSVGKTMDILFKGGSYGWRDLFGGMDPRSGVSAPTWTLFRGGIYLYAFSATQVREVFATFHVDHDYAMGTVMFPHMHWTVNTTSSGTVRWGFEYTVAKGHQQATGSIYGAPATVYVNQTVNGATDQYKHFVAEVSLADAIPATLLEPDTVILMRVFRDAANAADTYPDLVYGIQTDLHYQTARWATPNRSPDFYL